MLYYTGADVITKKQNGKKTGAYFTVAYFSFINFAC